MSTLELQPADRPEPKPGPGEILLKLKAISLNFRDLMVVKGQYNPKMPLPRIPVSDGVGAIAAVGPGANRFKVGDRVCGLFMPKWLGGWTTSRATIPCRGR